jgi:hypothetical protein
MRVLPFQHAEIASTSIPTTFDMFPSVRILHALVAFNLLAPLALAAPATCPAPKKIAQQSQMGVQETKQPVQQVQQPAKQVPGNSTEVDEGDLQTTPSSLQVQDLSAQDCCGYTITNRDNAYFRYRLVTDFSSSSLAEITGQGWEITDGGKAGATNSVTGQEPIGSKKNIKLVPGEGMAMIVPGMSSLPSC